MGKTRPKRRLNRKVKRSLRRTMAVVLLLTSLIVAAIPVPEAGAAGGEPTTPSSPTALVYPTSFTDFDIPFDSGLGVSTGASKPGKAYMVRQMSDGNWQLDWQFEYYEKSGEGVVSKYNSTYQQDEVTLSPNIVTKYVTVTEDEYKEFYEVTVASKKYEITYDDHINKTSKAESVNFLQKYFKGAYDTFTKDWDDFRKRHDAWKNANPDTRGDEPTLEESKKVLSKTPADLSEGSVGTDNQKLEYYCDENGYSGTKLIRVYDDTEKAPSTGTDTGRKVVYMPNGGDKGPDGYKKDKDGFWYKDTDTAKVIAIAGEAFKGVTNVKILHLPGEIKYIGKEAFMDSFIQKVTFNNIETIGHRAFKNCSQLVEVTLNDGVKIIGNEAFYAANITLIKFNYAIEKIGVGAFAFCTFLQDVDFSAISQSSSIEEFAFYNDAALNRVEFGNSKISAIGKACFAVETGVTGTMDTFVFPTALAKEPQLGDYMFAGRTNLKNVTFPADYGRSENVKVPDHMFERCINLECITFPADGGGSCGYVTFDPKLFKSVINEAFYIRGPEQDSLAQTAAPRKATWAASTAVSKYVPYAYKKKGVDYYEVSQEDYLLLIDGNGKLESCTAVENTTPARGFELIIPEKVGTILVKTIGAGCFDADRKIKENVGKVTIKDGGALAKIDNAVFKGCPYLKEVYVGNSVKTLGSEAFAQCPQLTDITFQSPADGNYGNFTIGKDALTTGSTKLTVHADVAAGYAPFTWAMDVDNYVDKVTGTRVCYKGLAPKYMTVIVDNATGMPTLVDYPKYNQIDIDNQDYINELAFYYVSKYGKQIGSGTGSETGGGSGTDGGESGGGTASGNDTALSITPGKDLYASLDDRMLFATSEENDPEVPEIPPTAAEYRCPNPSEYTIDNYTDFAKDYSIVKKYEAFVVNGQEPAGEWETMSPRELALIDATKNLVIPAGIKSIDARKFFEDETGANKNSILAYFKTTDDNYAMCLPGQGSAKDNIEPGIFSGLMKDYDAVKDPAAAAEYEKQIKGNDRVESITMSTVGYLPPYAFDSNERLKTIVLGEACKDIGIAPFRGCTNLVNVVANQYYESENGIIYTKKPDKTLQIEECLAARGSTGSNTVGTKYIDAKTDPLLANVSSLTEGAFQNCDFISKVDLSMMTKTTTIPKGCFNGCDGLSDVILPDTVNEIQEDAFSDTPTGLSVTIPGKEVQIQDTAFDHNEGTIRTYEDSSAFRYARNFNIDLELLSEKHKVTFLDYDGTELEVQYVENGGMAVPPTVPKRKGFTNTGWSGDYKGVTKDLLLIAQYKADANASNGSGGGSSTGTGTSGSGSSSSGSGSSDAASSDINTVTVINGTGSGTYKKGDKVTITANGPALGQTFDKWVTSSLNVAMANVLSNTTTFTMPDNAVVVTATFKSDGTRPSTGGTTTTVSGNTTTGTATGTAANASGNVVRVNKAGISNTNLASAVVNGSSDKFMVVISDSAEATAAIEAALQAQYGDRFPALRYVAMDISLYDATGTAKIENTQGLSVDITIPIPDALIQYGGNNRAISVANGALEHLGTRFTAIGGVPCMSFTATHFSPYGAYVDTENLTASMDMTPKTGDGIHPKWFLAVGLMCASIVLFLKKDDGRKRRVKPA